ncbi:MAG: M23 family metallopeptidase [Candidatus Nealsonbacteria bacterium]
MLIFDRKGLKKLIKKNRKKLKGSARDPFLYLGAICVCLFLIISIINPVSSYVGNANLLAAYPNSQSEDSFITPNTKVKESPDLSLVQQNSLASISPPIMVTPQVLGALMDAADYEWTQKEIQEYMVQPGDTLSSIAKHFNVSLNTLLWANDLTSSSLLRIGQKLVILPTSGTVHHVKNGDTLSDIAKTYKSTTEKIIVFNNLTAEGDIYIGDILIVPDGIMPPPTTYTSQLVPMAASYFICPISAPCRVTQGLHWYNAIDFSHGKCGEPIYAVAAGQVLKVKLTSSISKWAFGGAGNTIAIQHPNGVVTSYGHVQASLVSQGDYVSQGQIIALMGGALGMPGSGNSTGCHVHFGVSGAKNPFAK